MITGRDGTKVKRICPTEDGHECDAIKCGINLWFQLPHYHTAFDMWIFKRLQTCDQLLKQPLERKKRDLNLITGLNQCWCLFFLCVCGGVGGSFILEMLKEFMPRWSKAVGASACC